MTTYDFSALGFRDDDVAVVTGAGNGIGGATALMLAKSGLTVAAWDFDRDAVDQVVAEIVGGGGTATSILADLTIQSEIDAAWDQTDALGGPVRYVVNNAGPATRGVLCQWRAHPRGRRADLDDVVVGERFVVASQGLADRPARRRYWVGTLTPAWHRLPLAADDPRGLVGKTNLGASSRRF